MPELTERVAVVTGAGTGIGFACAQRLVDDGYRVGMLGRREEVLVEAAGRLDPSGTSTEVVTCDVSSSASVDTAYQQVASRFGRLDLLVNNAGALTPSSLAKTTDEDWHRMVGANLDGTFFGIRAATRLMRDFGDGGAVVNVASMYGALAVSGFGAYGATKAGIIHLTKVAALEGARHNIRVNAVLPGYVATPMSEEASEDPALMAAILERIPARRFADAGEIAGAVSYLASPAATYVTGTTLLIDGGYSLRP